MFNDGNVGVNANVNRHKDGDARAHRQSRLLDVDRDVRDAQSMARKSDNKLSMAIHQHPAV